MDIKKVEYRKPDPKALKEGKPTWSFEQFVVTTKDGNELSVPLDPRNLQYQEIQAWYEKQKSKPFEFKFETTPDLTDERSAALLPNNDENGKGINLTADQTADARLLETNLTREQRREIANRNKQ